MPIELTTGVPGAGKTLYTVAEVLKPLESATVEFNGKAIPRRLCIAGIPDLLVAHELVDAPPVHVDTFTDPWGDLVRRPADPPIQWVRLQAADRSAPASAQAGPKWVQCAEGDTGAELVPMLAENWWVWVKPGDVLVIDECQTVFRPMSAGKRAPGFIRQLEVHRHYGIDMVLITQHPQLIHTNVRSLVGKHRHVRRLFGRKAALIYEWDHCSPPDRIRTASTSVWRYSKKAFGLYKSAQLHTKQRFATSWPMLLGLVAIIGTPVAWYFAIHRTASGAAAAGQVKPAVIGEAPASAPAGAAPAAGTAAPGSPPRSPFPEYELSTRAAGGDPYGARAFQLEGEWSSGVKSYAVFGMVIEGQRVATVSLAALLRAGYTWTSLGPCAGLLTFGTMSRRVTCAVPSKVQTPSPDPKPDSPALSAT